MKTLLSISTSSVLVFLGAAAIAAPINIPKSSIGFEPNLGQAEAGSEFVAQGMGYRLALTRTESHMLLRNDRGVANLSWRLLDASALTKWESLDQLPSRSNYFRGQNPSAWVTNVPTFARVREAGVYPGIDLVYYGDQRQLEYDFAIAPGANPGLIRMRFGGWNSMRLDSAGNLVLETPAGQVIQHKPVVYQTVAGERRDIEGRFVLAGNRDVAFKIGRYDRSAPLTIDPVLAYSTFLGGPASDQGNAIAVDKSGNVYITGVTFSTKGGDGDVLVRKFSSSGAQVFDADLGGTDNDYGNGIQVDATGSIYVGGQTASSSFPVANAFQKNYGGSKDAFVLRLDASGQHLLFSTFLGDSGDDEGQAIALDSQGSVYITGFSTSSNFPVSTGSFQGRNNGGYDAFVAKYDSNGNQVYSTLLGGGSDDQGYGIAVDGSNNAYVTGYSASDSFPQVNNPFQHSRHGGKDAFVAELNAAGNNLVYSTLLGGVLDDYGYAIAVDAAGSAYITGKTGSFDFPTSTGTYSKNFNGGDNDIFVAKLNSGQAGLVYSTFVGTHGNDEGYAIAVDSAGVAYITGDTDSDQFPVTSGALQAKRAGNRDAIFAELSSDGTSLTYATFLGGAQNDSGYGIALDPSGNICVTGITSSSNFPVSSNAFQHTFGGGSNPDAFVAEISASGSSGAPAVNTGGVVNGANFGAGSVAPGSIISIFGTNFIGSATGATNTPLPMNLGGVTVSINGTPAPLFYVGPQQINAQVPFEVGAGSASLQVTTSAGTTSPVSFAVAQTAPQLNTNSTGRAIVQNQDGSLNSPSNPAKVGSIVTAYFTGIGPVSATVTDGAGSPYATSTLPNSATIGGVAAPVSYMGLSPTSVGLAQANVQIPASLGTSDYQLIITIGGVNSNSALIAVTQ